MSAILNIVMWILGKLLGKGPAASQEAQESAKAAAATVQAQGANNAVIELKVAAAARAAAARDSVRAAGTGAVTVDPAAAINSVDTEDRRD